MDSSKGYVHTGPTVPNPPPYSSMSTGANGSETGPPQAGRSLDPEHSRPVASPGPNDTVIAVMGVTGVGKSTFISHFAPSAVVGESLISCTAEVGIHRAQVGDQKIYLIDTPGFNDTTRSDSEILREVADWLNRSYKGGIKLAGIVYLHRINDTRMTGADMKNIRLFRKLCGDQGLSCVVLATTMWPYVSPTDGNRREQELIQRKDFWGGMVDKGSKVFRQDSGIASATKILQYIISQRHRITLEIQKEMASGKSLNQTAAGVEVQAELEKLKAAHKKEMQELRKDMEEARKADDIRSQNELAELRANLEAKMKKDEEDRRKMQVNMEQLQKQRDQELREERERAHQKDMKFQEQVLTAQAEMAQLRAQGEYEARLAESRLQNEVKAAQIARWEADEAERKRREAEVCNVM